MISSSQFAKPLENGVHRSTNQYSPVIQRILAKQMEDCLVWLAANVAQSKLCIRSLSSHIFPRNDLHNETKGHYSGNFPFLKGKFP